MAERARENERKETGNLKALVIVSQHWARGDGQRRGKGCVLGQVPMSLTKSRGAYYINRGSRF